MTLRCPSPSHRSSACLSLDCQLILVISINAGDLRDDSQPDFLREFHRALAVVSGDLFFARYRLQSDVVDNLKQRTNTTTLEAAKGKLV